MTIFMVVNATYPRKGFIFNTGLTVDNTIGESGYWSCFYRLGTNGFDGARTAFNMSRVGYDGYTSSPPFNLYSYDTNQPTSNNTLIAFRYYYGSNINISTILYQNTPSVGYRFSDSLTRSNYTLNMSSRGQYIGRGWNTGNTDDYFGGWIGDFLIYDGPMTDPEYEYVASYLTTKWAGRALEAASPPTINSYNWNPMISLASPPPFISTLTTSGAPINGSSYRLCWNSNTGQLFGSN